MPSKKKGIVPAVSALTLWLSLPSDFVSTSSILGIPPKELFILIVVAVLVYLS
jgi:hypothetical protein